MPSTLLDILVTRYPTAKRTTLRRMLQEKRIRVNGRLAGSMKQPIGEADRVEVADRPAARQAPTMPIRVVHEDADLIVIDKPAGLLTSTTPREKRPTALAIVRKHVLAGDSRATVGLIHRLDADASGLLVFSKNHEAYVSLKKQFFDHSVDRIYMARVDGVPNPAQGTIDSRLVEHHDGRMYVAKEGGKGERAVTYYETISRTKTSALVRVKLQTGKKHQIRVQLAQRGVPIANDPVYNSAKPAGRLMLAAVELGIDHPRTGKRMTFKVDPPSEMKPQMNADRGGAFALIHGHRM